MGAFSAGERALGLRLGLGLLPLDLQRAGTQPLGLRLRLRRLGQRELGCRAARAAGH